MFEKHEYVAAAKASAVDINAILVLSIEPDKDAIRNGALIKTHLCLV